MALLSRIFQSRKISRSNGCKWTRVDKTAQWVSPQFNPDNIRLVLYRDHGNDHRVLMYDSKSERQEPKKRVGTGRAGGECKPPPNPDPGGTPNKHQPMRQSSEHKLIGEMMFGSVPMSHGGLGGAALKVHTIRAPPQLLMTQVFVPTKPATQRTDSSSSIEHESFDSYSIQSSMGESSTPKQISCSDNSQQKAPSVAHSVPMDVPSPPKKDRENEDSGISGSVTSSYSSLPTTPLPSPSSSSSINSGSFNSLKRRFERHSSTSLEHLPKPRRDDCAEQPIPASKRPPKFGMCLIFNLPEEESDAGRQFQTFFFSHIMLIESHVHKMRVNLERALINRNKHMVKEALETLRASVVDLYTAPRLSQPVWLNMMCYSTQRVPLCHQFLKEFMTLVEKHDTKNTKFFMSTLITAVLTHHLAWVPTVTPAGAVPSRTYLDKHSAKWLDTLAKSHPYNPLWAQLGDLYGAIGFPLRLSRTVVTGKKADIVCKMLYVLSYFLRCSEVLETDEHRDREEDANTLDAHLSGTDRTGMTPIQESLLSRNNSSADMEAFSSPNTSGSTFYVALTTSTETHVSECSANTVISSGDICDKDPVGNTSDEKPYHKLCSSPREQESTSIMMDRTRVQFSKTRDNDVEEKKCPVFYGQLSRDTQTESSNAHNPTSESHIPHVMSHASTIMTPDVCSKSSDPNLESHDPAVIHIKVQKFFRVLDEQTAQRISAEASAMDNTLVRSKSQSSSSQEVSQSTLSESTDLQSDSQTDTENEPAVQMRVKKGNNQLEEDTSSECQDSEDKCQLSPAEAIEKCPQLTVNRHVGRHSDSSIYEYVSPTDDALPSNLPKTHSQSELPTRIPCGIDVTDGDVISDVIDPRECMLRTTLLEPSGCGEERSAYVGEISQGLNRTDSTGSIGLQSEEKPGVIKHDSGMFDVNSTELYERDIGAVIMRSISEVEESPSKALPSKDDYKKAIADMRKIAESIAYSRANSMFDEYFTDNSEQAVKTRSDLYKRFATIEGSNSIFDEYLSNPVQDFENCDIRGCEDEADVDNREGEACRKKKKVPTATLR